MTDLVTVLQDLLTVTKPAREVTESESENLGARYGLENGPWSDIIMAVRDAAGTALAKANARGGK